MAFEHSITHCFNERIAAGPGCDRLDALTASLDPALARLTARANASATPILDMALRHDDLAEIEALAGDIRARFSHVVVAGAGGSGLSGRTLVSSGPVSLSPRLHFLETIDPHALDDIVAQLPLKDTAFLFISKSGSTVETLGQFYVFSSLLKTQLGAAALAKHCFVITMQTASPLRESAEEAGMRLIAFDAHIGGRFSVFTAVGLLPAAIAGMDIRALRAGAGSIVRQLESAKHAADFAPAVGAALQYAFIERGRNISVMLPYSERLAGFSGWYRQSWAESLGKNGKGSTPIRAVGTTDQHSQLQLYLDGPKDKLFHLITLNRRGTGHRIDAPGRDDVRYIAGKTTGDIMAAEQKATLETLVKNGCPVRQFTLGVLDAHTLGALLMHFTLEIICMAELLGLNAFDQPAVEEGKMLAREYLLTGNL